MSDWYYAKNGAQQGPATLLQMLELIHTGQLAPTDLVWQDGMPQWLPAAQVPALGQRMPGAAPMAVGQSLSYEAPSEATLYVTPQAMQTLLATKPWVRFFSVLLFIGVGLAALGAAAYLVLGVMAMSSTNRAQRFAVVPAFVGGVMMAAVAAMYLAPATYLGRYASKIDLTVRRRRQDDFEGALEAQKSFWKFVGIATIVMMSLYFLLIIVLIGLVGR